NVFIRGGSESDLIHLYDMPDLVSTQSGVRDTMTIDGQDGADSVVVDTTGASSYIVNVHDTGALDSGTNSLTINGTGGDDIFLVRTYLVAALQSDGQGGYKPGFERVNYDETVTNRLTLNGGAGDDSYYLDGNSAVLTIDGGEGADKFQVGQMYAFSAIGTDPGDVGALPGDKLNVTATTLGYLSYGVEKATVIYGGTGNDTFNVYSNKADLSLYGEDGDDDFVVRAFLKQGSIKVSGGGGNGRIRHNHNQPLDIDGGAGFNTLTLLGTEANDIFVVTESGVFGGGLNVAFTNIQAVTVDALEGDDTFYVLSTSAAVKTTLIGGRGGDTFVVGG